MYNRNNVKTITVQMASIATNASAIQPAFRFPIAGEVVGVRFIASTSQPSATTTGSGLTITVYKNSSNAGSITASFNSSGTGAAANTAASATLGVAALKKFAAGDILLIEETGGAAMGSTLGAYVNVEYIYGYED